MTKSQAFAKGISPCRWRNMRYSTEHGKERLASYRRNAARASQVHKIRHRDFSYMMQPASPEIEQALKKSQRKLRQFKMEMHCEAMRAVHSANAAARRKAKAETKCT
ncbi:MAG: hypothetical protein L6437_04385 [Kiritimatiellae bacterium]|nr:hypothetical protein [Kiritimatiellia bacterium]